LKPCFFFGRHLPDELPTTKLWRVTLGHLYDPADRYDDDTAEQDAKTGRPPRRRCNPASSVSDDNPDTHIRRANMPRNPCYCLINNNNSSNVSAGKCKGPGATCGPLTWYDHRAGAQHQRIRPSRPTCSSPQPLWIEKLLPRERMAATQSQRRCSDRQRARARFPLRSRGPSPPACPTCPSRIETLVRRNSHVTVGRNRLCNSARLTSLQWQFKTTSQQRNPSSRRKARSHSLSNHPNEKPTAPRIALSAIQGISRSATRSARPAW
jgi:hypothetical protein